MRLRPARPDEGEWLFVLHEAAMRDRVERMYGPWDDEFQRAHFRSRDPRNEISIVEVDGVSVGAVHTRADEDRSMLIDLIEVLPAWQGKGIGAEVLRSLSTGPRDVTLRTAKDNPARRLYEREGFAVEAETDTHLVMRRPSSSGRREIC